MTPPLHPAIGKNSYCGPGALAILIGCSTDDAAKELRRLSGKRAIKRIHRRHVLAALAASGRNVWEAHPPQPQTLNRFVRTLAPGRYLVRVTGHLVVVRVSEDGAEIADNVSVYPMAAAAFPRKLKRATHAWRVEEAV